MNLEPLMRKLPEMSEEKLLENISKRLPILDFKSWSRGKYSAQDIINEWDLIQQKKSYLTKSQRDQINGFVSMCLIDMVKDDQPKEESNGTNNE